MTNPAPHTIKNPQTANSEGLRALTEGRPLDAASFFQVAIDLDPGVVPLWRNLATAYRQAGDAEGERKALKAALDHDRQDFTVWVRLAELHERLDEEKDAIYAWSGVLQMSSSMEDIPEELSQILAHAQNYVARRQQRLNEAVNIALSENLKTTDETSQRRMRAFVDKNTTQRRIYYNECAGLYYPFLPADEFFDDRHFPWFSQLSEKTSEIRAELLSLLDAPKDLMRPYVKMEKGTPENKWSTLDDSFDWTACFLWEYGVPNEDVLQRCPATRAALDAVPRSHIPNRAPSAFFSLLKPHTHIPPHTGVSNTRAIIHLPLIVPEKCGFRVGGETRTWVEGRPFAFDDTIEHEAWNNSDTTRAILIFDVWNPHLTQDEQLMIARYYDISDIVVSGK